ncbi:MAG TPA: hypothetical protein VD794_06780 [Flavisolibacter sp.]|nr:hypothetical protein [Flavisolibacter sp.]
MLRDSFLQVLNYYTNNEQLQEQLWLEEETHYTQPGRFYHTLEHLENMFEQLLQCKEQIDDWNTILFSLVFHDIVYDPLRADNEEKSADFAVQRLQTLSYPPSKIANCACQISATKEHTISEDADTNFFTDADLSILGSDDDSYKQYAANIRREYKAFPDAVYQKGRKAVLQHFLQMERIYKTAYFYEQFEKQARLNLSAELQQLI